MASCFSCLRCEQCWLNCRKRKNQNKDEISDQCKDTDGNENQMPMEYSKMDDEESDNSFNSNNTYEVEVPSNLDLVPDGQTPANIDTKIFSCDSSAKTETYHYNDITTNNETSTQSFAKCSADQTTTDVPVEHHLDIKDPFSPICFIDHQRTSPASRMVPEAGDCHKGFEGSYESYCSEHSNTQRAVYDRPIANSDSVDELDSKYPQYLSAGFNTIETTQFPESSFDLTDSTELPKYQVPYDQALHQQMDEFSITSFFEIAEASFTNTVNSDTDDVSTETPQDESNVEVPESVARSRSAEFVDSEGLKRLSSGEDFSASYDSEDNETYNLSHIFDSPETTHSNSDSERVLVESFQRQEAIKRPRIVAKSMGGESDTSDSIELASSEEDSSASYDSEDNRTYHLSHIFLSPETTQSNSDMDGVFIENSQNEEAMKSPEIVAGYISSGSEGSDWIEMTSSSEDPNDSNVTIDSPDNITNITAIPEEFCHSEDASQAEEKEAILKLSPNTNRECSLEVNNSVTIAQNTVELDMILPQVDISDKNPNFRLFKTMKGSGDPIEIDSDINVIVRDKHFKVHKDILMENSEYFRNILSTRRRPTYTYKIQESACVTAEAFASILEFLYNGAFPKQVNNIREVHRACIYLGIPSAKKECYKWVNISSQYVKDAVSLYKTSWPFHLKTPNATDIASMRLQDVLLEKYFKRVSSNSAV